MFTDLKAIFRHNYSPAIVWRQIVIMECRKLQNYIFCFERREKVAEGQQLFRQRIFWRRKEGWLIFVQRLENYILQIPFQSMRCLWRIPLKATRYLLKISVLCKRKNLWVVLQAYWKELFTQTQFDVRKTLLLTYDLSADRRRIVLIAG